MDIDLTSIVQPTTLHLPGYNLTITPAGSQDHTTPLTLSRLHQLRAEFLDHLRVDRGLGISILDYERRTAQFLIWATPYPNLTPNHWRDYYIYLLARHEAGELSAQTLKNYHGNLSRWAEWLRQRGQLAVNPLATISPPEPIKATIRSKAAPVADMVDMINAAATPRDRALLTLFRDTGLRRSEAASLTWPVVNLVAREITVLGKGNKERMLPITEPTTALLQQYHDDLPAAQRSGPVWWGRQGPLSSNGIYRVFCRLARRAHVTDKISRKPHAWRHAFGRDCTKNGMPTIVLQRIMGHESIETTSLYIDADTDIIKQLHDKYSPLTGLPDS